MRIKTLEPSDVELFYSFRLRGLMENPEAFGSTFAEESVMSALAARRQLER